MGVRGLGELMEKGGRGGGGGREGGREREIGREGGTVVIIKTVQSST